MAIAGLVLGIVALVFSFIPLLGAFIAIPCALVGLPLSVFGLKGQESRRGMAIAGAITCFLGLVLSIVLTVSALVAVDEAIEELQDLPTTPGLANDDGRDYMLRQPCTDVMSEYNSVKGLNDHDLAVSHVASVYNIKTGFDPFIANSDASARVTQCMNP